MNLTPDAAFALALLLFVAVILAAYGVGRAVGHKEGMNTNSGWEDEARWWRKNSVGVVAADQREEP